MSVEGKRALKIFPMRFQRFLSNTLVSGCFLKTVACVENIVRAGMWLLLYQCYIQSCLDRVRRYDYPLVLHARLLEWL
jgi:hypothetical protein